MGSITELAARGCRHYKQQSRAAARTPRDAAAVFFGLKFAMYLL